VICRRTLLLAPLLLSGQTRWKPKVFTYSGRLPEGLIERSVVFPRAYTCCPRLDLARTALETGRFPHQFQGEAIRSILPDLDEDSDVRSTIQAYADAAGDGADTPFERSVKVPLLIYAPGLLAPRTAEEILISTVDLAPTLLGLCGLSIPESVQGRDLSGLLLGKKEDLPDSVYVEGSVGQKDEWRTVIRGFDKLVMDMSGNVTHLFNLANDPEEKINLAQDPAEQLTVDALVALARVWMRKLGDGMDPSGLKRRP
jgi:arylsulfatase A-like enzyme